MLVLLGVPQELKGINHQVATIVKEMKDSKHQVCSQTDCVNINRSSKVDCKNIPSLVKKPVKVHEVHCSKLFAGNQMEIEHAWAFQENQSLPEISAEELLSFKNNCSDFKQKFGFITSPLTEEEERFPIAYSILAFKTPVQESIMGIKTSVQMLNLLKTSYRPQNYYCIHIDSKPLLEFTATITTITSCFENVFQSSRSADIVWGTITVLEAELICMEDLWKYKAWKYFINLTGQEFPLKTNLEIVRFLTAFRGANDVDSTVKRAYTYLWNSTGPPPHNLTLTIGSVHAVVNRYFVDFILHNPIAHDIFEWCRNTKIPDETFFATLNHNPHLGIPGSYTVTSRSYKNDQSYSPTNFTKITVAMPSTAWEKSCTTEQGTSSWANVISTPVSTVACL